MNDHITYIARRVLDALLREDVRGCVSRAEVLYPSFAGQWPGKTPPDAWLKVSHLGEGQLWLPVLKGGLLQDWRSAGMPLGWEEDGRMTWLADLFAALERFRAGLTGVDAETFGAFDSECRTAIAQRALTEAERERFFARAPDPEWLSWHARLLYYDRLASFQDHPFYATARAKLGFDAGALAAYAPEFQRPFRLHWLVVPHALIERQGELPVFWPGFANVGLDRRLAASHELFPVHPFLWERRLDETLAKPGLDGQVLRAPLRHLTVMPTLSVRTVAVAGAPGTHLKLPLPIRTLGARNLRTINPVTIRDGHTMQSLLAEICTREPFLRERLWLTDESAGAHAAGEYALAYIVRRYPLGLDDQTLVPVAALAAATPGSGRVGGHSFVMEALAGRFYNGDLVTFLTEYAELILRTHLPLWLRYGIALESNPQNSILAFTQGQPLRLLLKDNDAARLHRARITRAGLGHWLERIRDPRLIVEDDEPLAQLFITINLQLNLGTVIEAATAIGRVEARALYRRLREGVETVLAELSAAGEDVNPARRALLKTARLPVKYMLTAGSLLSKATTGTLDVNKFYGRTGPNFLVL